jgi:hypothetical protein
MLTKQKNLRLPAQAQADIDHIRAAHGLKDDTAVIVWAVWMLVGCIVPEGVYRALLSAMNDADLDLATTHHILSMFRPKHAPEA